MKYKFEKLDIDDYVLTYTNVDNQEVKLPFKRTIELGSTIQEIPARARLKMFKEMSKNGIKKDDLIIRTKRENGTIDYDETNYREYESSFIKQESAEVLDELIKKCFSMSLVKLFESFKLNDKTIEKDSYNFTTEFLTIIAGKDETPSETKLPE